MSCPTVRIKCQVFKSIKDCVDVMPNKNPHVKMSACHECLKFVCGIEFQRRKRSHTTALETFSARFPSVGLYRFSSSSLWCNSSLCCLVPFTPHSDVTHNTWGTTQTSCRDLENDETCWVEKFTFDIDNSRKTQVLYCFFLRTVRKCGDISRKTTS